MEITLKYLCCADSILSLSLPFFLQYLIIFGGFNELDGKEKCFSDLHYVDIATPSGNTLQLKHA